MRITGSSIKFITSHIATSEEKSDLIIFLTFSEEKCIFVYKYKIFYIKENLKSICIYNKMMIMMAMTMIPHIIRTVCESIIERENSREKLRTTILYYIK